MKAEVNADANAKANATDAPAKNTNTNTNTNTKRARRQYDSTSSDDDDDDDPLEVGARPMSDAAWAKKTLENAGGPKKLSKGEKMGQVDHDEP